MRARLDRRFPMKTLLVYAAIFDSSRRHLTLIQQYLTEHETNDVQLLSIMIIGDRRYRRYRIYIGDIPPIKKMNVCGRKSNCMEMFANHIRVQSSSDRELHMYRCSSAAPGDVPQ